ncbi:hypothetical protein ACU610_01930 [Geodermatophilus sp. URMC 61]|uniref:hypothetical protein n=1 Tax=Geodermatophilus sp. URMC 61 TaxID=3423411 RepID=UPI00406D1BCF
MSALSFPPESSRHAAVLVADSEQAPAFPIVPAANRPWREGAITRANEFEALTLWMEKQPDSLESAATFSQAVRSHVEIARQTAMDHHLWRGITGASLQRTQSNLDAAEASLLRLAPASYLQGQLPGFRAHVRRHLPRHDPRRARLEALASTRPIPLRRHRRQDPPAESPAFSEEEREIIVGAMRAASSEAVRQLMQANSFRNLLGVTSVMLILLAVAVAVLGMVSPSTVPLCFSPETRDTITVVCPTQQHSEKAGTGDVDDVFRQAATGGDAFTIEALGLTAAAISAAVALRNVRGTSTPVAIPIALAILKLPLGALTAVLGLLLMRGGFVPGLSALDSSAQILAWAVLFGYAQQVFTRLIDQQAHTVLDKVRTQAPPEAPTAAAARADGA